MNVDKWIVVTGASSGIGLKTAEILIENGYKVVVTSRNKEKLNKLFETYNNEFYRVIDWDLNNLSSIMDYVKKVNEEVGAICGLVHCAGIQSILPIHLLNEKKILDNFNINTFSGMLLVSSFSKRNFYIENDTSFILISSLSAHEGALGRSIYGASKGALEGFLLPAASELMYKGIRINIIVPGVVNAGQGKDYYSKLTDIQKEELNKSYPLGINEDVDIANMIEYLISNKSKKITGQKIIIDGGHLVRKV